jgi:hypothetical protein
MWSFLEFWIVNYNSAIFAENISFCEMHRRQNVALTLVLYKYDWKKLNNYLSDSNAPYFMLNSRF